MVQGLIVNHFNVWDKWSDLWSDTMMRVMCSACDPCLCPFTREERALKKSKEPARKVGGRRMKLRRGVTLDSGAADNVIPRRMLRKWMRIRQSPGSRKGVHDVAANTARIKNEGEVYFQFESENKEMQS